jgi:hypothetical protein
LSKLEHYKQKTAQALVKNRDTMRGVVSSVEVIAGAAAGGYLAATYPTIAKVPSDAGLGIALVVGGMSLKQKDLTAIGLGMLAGYAHDMGAQMALGKSTTTTTAATG